VRGWDGMSGIVTCCVCVPDVDEDVGQGLTSFYVDDTYVEELMINNIINSMGIIARGRTG
jgi:hypothetical protein